MTSQFEGAERIAEKWGITREDTDAFGLASQQRAAAGVGRGPLRRADRRRSTRPTLDEDGKPDRHDPHASTATRACARPPSRSSPRSSPSPARTACTPPATSSQISDGAAAVLLMTAEKAAGARPHARGPASSTRASSASTRCSCSPARSTPPQHLLERTGLTIDDIDVFEINEAFASVVLAWAKELGADMAKVNPNGGAIALGHPLGGTGAVLSPRRCTS